MMITNKRIIDNKEVELTEPEWVLYQKICKSYDKPTLRGESLFQGLFETDGNGIITFILPPDKKQFTFEVWLYLASIMINQHLRINHEETSIFIEESKQNLLKLVEAQNATFALLQDKVTELEEKISTLGKKLNKLSSTGNS